MESDDERILSFIADWFDPQPQINKRFLLKYHCATNEVEMKDIQTKRSFLKKTKIPPTLKESDFYLGANIVFLARDLRLTEYADSITRQLLESEDELTVCVLLPALYESLGEVITMIETKGGFTLVNMKSICLRRGDKDLEEAVTKLLNVDRSDIIEPGPMVAMSFRGSNSISSVNTLIQTSTFAGLLAFPNNATEAAAYDNFFFKKRQFDTNATFEECTCCVIKPHAVKERLVGSIIRDIHFRGFVLSAVAMFQLERSSAAEFLEVYGGVFPEYNEMVDEMCSGSIVALEVRLKPQLGASTYDESGHPPPIGVVEKFRAHAGPWDVSMGEWCSIVIVC
jgi:nucleoside-diphosphate kinase